MVIRAPASAALVALVAAMLAGGAPVAALTMTQMTEPVRSSVAPAFASGACSASFSVVDVGVLPGADYSLGFAINASGRIIGDSNHTPFVWRSGRILALSSNGNAFAEAINAFGDVVGTQRPLGFSNPLQALVWLRGATTPVQLPPLSLGSESAAHGINGARMIVGGADESRALAWVPADPTRPVFTVQDLAIFGRATAINASGDMVGIRHDPVGPGIDAFFRPAVGRVDFFARDAVPHAINDAQQVVGTLRSAHHAFVWSSGTTPTDLGVFPTGLTSDALAINNLSQVVGSGDANDATTAFVHCGGAFNDLNRMLPPGSGWRLTEATGINDAGQIVGTGQHNGLLRAFLLNPPVLLTRTATALTSRPNPSVGGDAVALTATVTAVAPATATPTGVVDFFDGTTLLGTVEVLAGVATLTTSALPVGSRTLTGRFVGDFSFADSTSSAVVQVVRPPPPDLEIVMVPATASFHTGPFGGTYKIDVFNRRGPTVGPITVTDALPASLSFHSARSADGFTCAAVGQAVTCTKATPIAPGSGARIWLDVNVDHAAVPTVTNTATVSTPGDTNPANDSSTVTVSVTPSITVSPTTFGAGQIVRVNGTGFAAAITVNIWFDFNGNLLRDGSEASTTVVTDASGSFSDATLTVRPEAVVLGIHASSPGAYFIRAEGPAGTIASASITVGTCFIQDQGCTINGQSWICLVGDAPRDTISDCKAIDSDYSDPIIHPNGYDFTNVGPRFLGAGVLAAAAVSVNPVPASGCVAMTAAITVASNPPYNNVVPDQFYVFAPHHGLLSTACGVPPFLPPLDLLSYATFATTEALLPGNHGLPDPALDDAAVVGAVVATTQAAAAAAELLQPGAGVTVLFAAQQTLAAAAVAGDIACGFVNYYCNGSDITANIIGHPAVQTALVPYKFDGQRWGDIIGWAQAVCHSNVVPPPGAKGDCETPSTLPVPGSAGPFNNLAPITCATGRVIGLSIGYDGDVSFDVNDSLIDPKLGPGLGTAPLTNYHNFQPGPGGSESPAGIDIEVPLADRAIFLPKLAQLRIGTKVKVCGRWVADMHQFWNELHPVTELDILDSTPPNTPLGTNVRVPLGDPATSSSVTLTFDNVTGVGLTSLNVTSTGAPPPIGFSLGSPARYYDVTTTATFTGAIGVCIDIGGLTFSGAPRAFHREGGTWVDRTASFDAATHTLCASVTTLSPFIVAFESPRSLALDGSTGYAEANGAKLNLTGDWTVEAWFRDEDPNGFDHDYRQLINKGDRNSNPESPYFVLIGHNHLLAGVRTGGQDYPIDFDLAYGGVDPGAWHHVAVTFRADLNVLNLWIDGLHRGYLVVPVHSTAGNALPLQIGRSGPTSDKYWLGKIDDLRLWNVARKGVDISATYQHEPTGTSPVGLAANWKFNEASGTTAADSTASPANATLHGGATFSSDVHPPITTTSYDMNVLVLKYFPLSRDGQNIDISVTGDVGDTYAAVRQRTIDVTNNLSVLLPKATRYRGYADPSAPPSLRYRVVATKEFTQAAPFGPRPGVPRYPDYPGILASNDICAFVDTQGVQEVWLWAYQGPPQADGHAYLEISESKMSGPFGDISNSQRFNDLPLCHHTYRVYTFNYGRGTSEAMESWGHQMEAELATVDSTLFRERWQGPAHPQTLGVTGRCGSVHNPPNARFEYDRANPIPTNSDCLAWNPDGLGPLVAISCANWGCADVSDVNNGSLNYMIWNWQNLPGQSNGKAYRDQLLRNWWDVHGDFDGVMGGDKTLIAN